MQHVADLLWLLMLATLLCSLIGMFVLLPVNFMDSILTPLNKLLYHYVPGVGVSAGKLGHGVAFFLLTLSALQLRRKLGFRWLWVIVSMTGFSIFTELLQLAIDGRTARLEDLLFDLAGVALAFLVYGAVGFLIRALRALR